MSNSNDQMLEMFLFEMSSLIDQLDEVLLSSEKNQALTEENVGEIFRIMHTVKGSSAMMDFNVISTVTHRLEDTFFYIRDNGIDPGFFTELFDLMLDATDFLKSQLEAIQDGGVPAEGNDELIGRAVSFLNKLKSGEAAPAASAPAKAAASPAEAPKAPVPVAAESAAGGDAYQIEVLFEEDCGMENLRAFMLVTTLKQTCEIIGMDPPDIESNPETANDIMINGFTVVVATGEPEDKIRTVVENSMHVKSAVFTKLDAVPCGGAAAAAGSDIVGDTYEINVHFETDCGMENLRAFMLINSMRERCKILSFYPEDIERNPESAHAIVNNGLQITLRTAMSQGALQKAFDEGMYVANAVVSKIATAESTAPAPRTPASAAAPAGKPAETEKAAAPAAPAPANVPAKAPAAASKPIKQNLINVSLSKLDELMDLMGELVITESMVTRSPDLKYVDKLDNFNKSARQLMKLTDELQDMVMSIRMIPVSGTFQKMQRIVRDMCRTLGKEAELVTFGEETDIDKTIIDGIADPIMHLVRNAMDHGIELPEEREAAGKPRKATVTLSAQNTGGEILITVSDNGKGLDAEQLLAKAKKNGILTKPANEYSEKEAFMLLMMPGFSTKEKVTEYSGRGVGMDVVKKNIEKIGGTVVIESKKGQGMSVFLKIPLTLAIVDGMDVSVGGGIYTLQITAINESFKATQEQVIVDTHGNEMIMIRGNVYPIIRLHELYNIPNALTNIEDGILIWVQSGDDSVCLFVDELIGEQQIVVKAMPVYLSKYDYKAYGISGCTILGDGNISLILDVGAIIEKVMEKR